MRTEDATTAAEEAENQRERLRLLLEDLEREHGPIDPSVLEDVGRQWRAGRGAPQPT